MWRPDRPGAVRHLHPEDLGRETAADAISMLNAIPAPARPMPVIVSNGWGGVLFHEAVGHGLEADHLERNSSVYAGKLGERVAAPIVTLLDDATVPRHRGSFRVDDEGVAAQRTPLVVGGIMEGYLTDRKHARALGLTTTGNGRRQSFQKLPRPRMTNLIVEPGTSTPAEILADTPSGLYVASLGGGQVDTTSGQFVFSVTEGYLIVRRELAEPVSGVTLAAPMLDVLANVREVGSDLRWIGGTGGYVGSGSVLADDVMIGGR